MIFPFFCIKRRRKSFTIFLIFFISCVFIVIYQILMYKFVTSSKPKYKVIIEDKNAPIIIKGTHIQELLFYQPNNGKFTCIKSLEIIDFNKINDDYCDCADSTDEPGTNACPDGIFHCKIISISKKFYPLSVPSSKVNDGICDCCDGSDEYKISKLIGNNTRKYCPNNC